MTRSSEVRWTRLVGKGSAGVAPAAFGILPKVSSRLLGT
jgi:hypothetical protein